LVRGSVKSSNGDLNADLVWIEWMAKLEG